jgi:DNA-binding IclR family transcriptional regulator
MVIRYSVLHISPMNANMIQSVNRALQILGLFSLVRPRLGITEISRALGLHKGTVQGLVRTLTDQGFLEQDSSSKKYQLGSKLYELGIIRAGVLEINQKASIPAHQLALRTERLVRIATWDKNSVLVTMDVYPRSQPFLNRQFETRIPPHCTSLGKALLAFLDKEELALYLKQADLVSYTPNTILRKDQLLKDLDETRRRGYSLNRGEHLLGRAGLGAPIFGREKRLVGAICLVCAAGQDGKNITKYAEDVKATALEISRHMGYFAEAHAAERTGDAKKGRNDRGRGRGSSKTER